MARLFDETSTDHIEWSSHPSLKVQNGVTVSAWVRLDTDTSDIQRVIELRQADTTFVAALSVQSDGILQLALSAGPDALWVVSAASTIAFDGTLYHIAATTDGSTTPGNYNLYVNGVDVTASSEGSSGNALNTDGTSVVIGCRNLVPDRGVDGLVAEVGFWELEQPVEVIAALASGYSPSHYPIGLEFYPSLLRDLQSVVSGVTGSATGTTVTTHPRIIYPARPQIITAPTASGVSITVLAANHYRRMRA